MQWWTLYDDQKLSMIKQCNDEHRRIKKMEWYVFIRLKSKQWWDQLNAQLTALKNYINNVSPADDDDKCDSEN